MASSNSQYVFGRQQLHSSADLSPTRVLFVRQRPHQECRSETRSPELQNYSKLLTTNNLGLLREGSLSRHALSRERSNIFTAVTRKSEVVSLRESGIYHNLPTSKQSGVNS